MEIQHRKNSSNLKVSDSILSRSIHLHYFIMEFKIKDINNRDWMEAEKSRYGL